MAEYKVPEGVKEGFSIIIKSSQKKIDTLINALRKAPKGLSRSDVSDYLIKKKIYSKEESSAISDVLYSLYRLKGRETISLEEIIDNIFLALKETKELKPKKSLKENLKKLLSLKTIETAYKALGLLSEYEKIYIDGRIITDIRPVFYDDIDEKIETGVIVHNLRIEYHTGEASHKEIYIALDSDDLNKLKGQILRAEKKEKTIKDSFKNSIFFIETA